MSHSAVATLPVESPYKRGYRPPDDLKAMISAAHSTWLWRSVAAALTDHAMAVGFVVGEAIALVTLPPWGALPLAALCLAAVGRQLRALECLTHEASHLNWSRQRQLNDTLAFLLAGLPTGASILDYRRSHRQHHSAFGTSADPDLTRYLQLDIGGLRRHSGLRYAWELIRRLPRYQSGWVKTIKTNPLFCLLPALWCVLVVGLPATLLLGPRAGLLASAMWIAAYCTTLPAIRFIGEAEEHIYSGRDTVFAATISNTGLLRRLMIHPHNDGFHTVHHMWPGIPYYAARRVHSQLLRFDPNFAARLVTRRPISSSA